MSLPAVAAFGGNPVRSSAVCRATRLPKPDAHLQNPLLSFRRVRLVKRAVAILDAHERLLAM
jgi:hypothetical protein